VVRTEQKTNDLMSLMSFPDGTVMSKISNVPLKRYVPATNKIDRSFFLISLIEVDGL